MGSNLPAVNKANDKASNKSGDTIYNLQHSCVQCLKYGLTFFYHLSHTPLLQFSAELDFWILNQRSKFPLVTQSHSGLWRRFLSWTNTVRVPGGKVNFSTNLRWKLGTGMLSMAGAETPISWGSNWQHCQQVDAVVEMYDNKRVLHQEGILTLLSLCFWPLFGHFDLFLSIRLFVFHYLLFLCEVSAPSQLELQKSAGIH